MSATRRAAFLCAQKIVERVHVDGGLVDLVQIGGLAANERRQMYATGQRVTARADRFESVEDGFVGITGFAQRLDRDGHVAGEIHLLAQPGEIAGVELRFGSHSWPERLPHR